MILAYLLVLAGARVDLDAPLIVEKPTLRSEMQRGQDAAFACETRPRSFDEAGDANPFLDCVENAESENRQKMGRGFEAFDAGLWWWARENIKIIYTSFPTDLNKSALDVASAGANTAENILRISDGSVASVMHRR